MLAAGMFVMVACQSDSQEAESLPDEIVESVENTPDPLPEKGCKSLDKVQTLEIGGVAVEIQVPSRQVVGDLLILPGWSYPRDKWCRNSNLCRKALRKGYRLIMPEMGKSIYASEYYEETRKDWQAFPTRTWLTETMIPQLQEEYCLLEPGSKNFVVGLSTGGRGVALVALHTGTLFTAGAALSGDYDQSLMASDNLMRGVYGDMEQFPERWSGMDNPAKQAAQLAVPLYLAHGKKDAIVPWSQTEHFYNVLKKENPSLQVKLHLAPEHGHDFAYWNSEVGNMLEFFNGFQKTMPESSEMPK